MRISIRYTEHSEDLRKANLFRNGYFVCIRRIILTIALGPLSIFYNSCLQLEIISSSLIIHAILIC